MEGVTGRFGFDALRISQVQKNSQKQGNGNASWGVYIQSPFVLSTKAGIYNKHQRGAFCVARFDYSGNARAFRAWNEQQVGLHVFCFVLENVTEMTGGATVFRQSIYYENSED